MKKRIWVIAALMTAVALFGCGKKAGLEQAQEPMSIEALSTAGTQQPQAQAPQVPAQAQPEAAQVQQAAPAAAKLEPLPPAGPFKPSVEEIQTALKNAGFYTGNIDGKKGPLTKKAVEEFQKSKGLAADGKVGPKTWSVLSAYLNTAPVQEPTSQAR